MLPSGKCLGGGESARGNRVSCAVPSEVAPSNLGQGGGIHLRLGRDVAYTPNAPTSQLML